MLFTDVQRSVRLNKKKKSTNTSPYPDEVIDRLARAFYPAILACWNSEEGQRSLVGARPLHLAAQDRSVAQKPHWGFHCCAALRKRELLQTRHFRQLARKHGENFGKKREGWTLPALLTKNQGESCIETQCKGI